MVEKIKVRLTTDLTKYLPGLVEGTEGFTVGSQGIWSRSFNRFVSVNFPGKGTIDVLWKSLEVIDEKYLQEKGEREAKRLEEYKSAKNVIKHVGPRGGFKNLSYEYIDSNGAKVNTTLGIKSEAETLIEVFNSYGIEVMEKVI
ncbi:MAG: hypothetical protein ABF649_18485 [Bacillus sp. (in: firmicutes)]